MESAIVVYVWIILPLIITCTESTLTNLIDPDFPILPRCCADNEYYDTDSQRCVTSTSSKKQWLSQYLNHFKYPTLAGKPIRNEMNCKGSLVIQYTVEIENLRYNNRSIMFKDDETSQFHINVHDQQIAKTYCIDPTEDFSDYIVIQVCQDMTTCKSNCIRICESENDRDLGVTSLLIKSHRTESLMLDRHSFNRYDEDAVGKSNICHKGFQRRYFNDETIYRVSEAGELRLPEDKYGYLKIKNTEYCIYPATILTSMQAVICPEKIFSPNLQVVKGN